MGRHPRINLSFNSPFFDGTLMNTDFYLSNPKMISSSAPAPLSPLPLLVVHCDWSTNPKKRWMARAFLGKDGDYQAFPPERVGNLANLLLQLAIEAGPGGRLLVGFDFPIGLPDGYASRAGVDDFLTLLPNLGQGEWADFYTIAELPEQISLRRP